MLSPDLVLVLPPEERRRAIAELAAAGPPIYHTPALPAEPPEPVASRRLATSIARYAIYKSVVVVAWYVVLAVAIGLVVAALAVR